MFRIKFCMRQALNKNSETLIFLYIWGWTYKNDKTLSIKKWYKKISEVIK